MINDTAARSAKYGLYERNGSNPSAENGLNWFRIKECVQSCILIDCAIDKRWPTRSYYSKQVEADIFFRFVNRNVFVNCSIPNWNRPGRLLTGLHRIRAVKRDNCKLPLFCWNSVCAAATCVCSARDRLEDFYVGFDQDVPHPAAECLHPM